MLRSFGEGVNILFFQEFLKNTIRDGGSTTLYAANTVDTVYTVDMVYTLYTVDTVDMVYTVIDMTYNE